MRKADGVAAVAILLDLVMPSKDGWVVYEAIREHPMTRDVPVIMMNGQDPGDQWRRRGVDGFVAKPIVRENLIRELARVASPPVARSMRIERPYARRV